MNQCNFAGNVGKDPEIRYMPNGKMMATFSLAVSSWKPGVGDEKGKEETTWIDFVAFGGTAERVSKIVGKGTRLAVTGKFSKRKVDDKWYSNFIVDNFTLMGKGRTDGENDGGAETGAEVENIPF